MNQLLIDHPLLLLFVVAVMDGPPATMAKILLAQLLLVFL